MKTDDEKIKWMENASRLRESREWWAIDDAGQRVCKVTGFTCAPNNPGYWWVPSLGSSMSEKYHLFETEREALAKHIGNLEKLVTETQERLTACRLQLARIA